MSKGSTVSLTLQLKGQQAQEVINRLQQSQKNNTNELVRTNKHLESVLRQQATHTQKQAQQVQQLTQLNQHNARTVAQQETQTRANLRTNQLLERVLQQQSRQTTLQSQQLRSQNRDYQLQVNMLRQQAAAAERLRNQLSQANHEDRQINNRNRGGLGRGAGLIGGVAGGFMAAKAMASAPLERGRNFSATIFDATASITNGFDGMSKEQAKAQNQKLMQYAKDAVRQGHGTVEGVSQAAGVLSASGIYDTVDDLKLPLQAIAKSSFASGADEVDMAKLAQQIKQFGVSVDRTQVAFDRMIGSGQAGGFELKDMSQFLPKILASAKSSGYAGESGLNQVTTHLQLARKYTGTPGEAATNIDALYELVNQGHFKLAMAKHFHVDPKEGDPTKIGKKGKRVFDLTTYLANNQLKGIDTVSSVAMLMDRQLAKDKKYQDLQKKLKVANSNNDIEQATRIKSALALVTAGKYGDIFHNKESLGGISAIVTGMQNGDYKEIYDKSWNKEGSTATLADIKGDNEFAQAEALQQEKILAQIKIYETVNEKLGGFEKGLVNVMQSNEGLTAAILAATGAAITFTTALGGASLLLGRSPIGAGGGGRGAGAMGATGGAAAVAAAGLVGWGVGTVINDNYVEGTQFGHDLGGTIATIMQHMPDSMGGKEAREALDSEMAYLSSQASQQNQKTDQQLLDNQQLIVEVRKMSSALGNLKLDFPQPSTSTFVNQINDHNKDTGGRHGAVFPYRIP